MNKNKLLSRLFITLALISSIYAIGIGMILFGILSMVFWIIGWKQDKKKDGKE